jgi:hypothetical protein
MITSGSTTHTVTASRAKRGNATFTVRATGGGVTHTQTATISVT